MRLQVIPLDFLGQGALLLPKDRVLHDLLVDYCRKNLSQPVNLSQFAKCWAVVEVSEQGEPAAIHGTAGFVWKPDVPMFRATGPHANKATALLVERMNGFFADQGMRGGEAFVYISDKETPEQRCPAWEESLKAAGAEPAERFRVKIR